MSIPIAIVLVGGGFWFLFTLQYTGRGGRLIPFTAAAMVGIWLLIILAVLVTDITPAAEVPAASNLEFVLFVGSYLMGVLMIVGAALILTTSFERSAVRIGEALALAGGGALLAFASIAATTLQASVTTPAIVSLASGLFGVALARYPVFEAPPVARIAGRDRVIEELEDPVVVVDIDGRVRDLNPASEHYFDVDSAAVLGAPLEALLPTTIDPATVATTQEPVQLRTAAGATLTVRANRITDARDRGFGHLLVFRDVTERQRRERRLSVLNQLLTEAVSSRMHNVAAAVEPLATESEAGDSVDATPSVVGDRIRRETTGLLDLVARTRDIERTLAREGTGPIDVMAVVREVTTALTAETSVDIGISSDDSIVAAAIGADGLETILELLLTDALERGATTIRIDGVGTDTGPELRLIEDGAMRKPTADADRAAADRPSARSELVVEMVRQAVRHVGGDVAVHTSEPGRRQTVLELPAVGGDAPIKNDSRVADAGTAGATGGRQGVRDR